MDFSGFIWVLVGIGLTLGHADDKVSNVQDTTTAWMTSGTLVTEIEDTITSRSSEECFKLFKANKTRIRSPDYPYYESNQRCTYLILAPRGQIINVDFTEFSLEYHSECNYDYLKIYDGGLTTIEYLGKFCGDLRPHRVTSTGNVLLMTFSSDQYVNGRGFEAIVTFSTGTQVNRDDVTTTWQTRVLPDQNDYINVTEIVTELLSVSTTEKQEAVTDQNEYIKVSEIVTELLSVSSTEKQEAVTDQNEYIKVSEIVTELLSVPSTEKQEAVTDQNEYINVSEISTELLSVSSTEKQEDTVDGKRDSTTSPTQDQDSSTFYFTSGVTVSDDLTTPSRSNVRVCPDEWHEYGKFCYFIKTSPGDFLDANQYCKTHRGKVACIQSEEEQEFVMSLLTADVESYFIGMRLSDDGQTWHCTDNTEISFVNWNSGMPDGRGDEDCVEMYHDYDGKWDDVSCRMPFNGAICKASLDEVSVTEPIQEQISSITSCHDGWTKHHGGSSYCLMTREREWASARRKCSGIDAHLLQVDDSFENDFISYTLSNSNLGFVWLGITDKVKEGVWMTDTNRPVSGYTNWESLEQDNSSKKDCAVMFLSWSNNMRHGSWHVNSCRHEFAFICEK